jgi:hypothetical protein
MNSIFLRPKLHKINLNKINKFLNNETIENRILTNNGFYKFDKYNNLKYYIIKKNDIYNELITIDNIDNIEFILQEDIFIVDVNEIQHIPYNNKIISIYIKKYELPNTNIFFYIEYLDKNIIDFYFLINKDQHLENNFNINISTFISNLK